MDTPEHSPADPGALRGVTYVIAGVALSGLLVAGSTAGAAALEPWRGLQALPRIALEVVMSPELPGLSTDELERRIRAASATARPAPTLDPSAPDRLRLGVAVRPHSSAELRGFYLPFSGTYGIGPVRLVVERPVTIASLSQPVPAIVWEAERLAKGPWRLAATEIRALVDAVLAAFLNDYRRAAGP